MIDYSTSRFKKLLFNKIVYLCILVSLLNTTVQAQRHYAKLPSTNITRTESATAVLGIGNTWLPTNVTTTASVENSSNAAIPTTENYATLTATSVEVLFVATYVGRSSLTFDFSETYPTGIPNNQKSYIQIDAPTGTGINIKLLELLGLINKSIYIEHSIDNVNWTRLADTQLITNRLGDTESGKYYLEATPKTNYKFLRATIEMQVGLLDISLGGGMSLNVYNAFTEQTSAADCGYAWATNEGEFSGLTVNVGSLLQTLGLTYNSFVNSPGFAVDGDINTASTLTSGLLGVNVGTISQTLLFKGLNTSSDDEVKVTLGFGASLLKLGLFDGIQLQAFNGETAIGQPQTLSALLLNLDLLGLFSNGRKYPVTFKPGAPFDRVKISSINLLDVELAEVGLKIYEAERTIERPTTSNSQEYIISGTQPKTTANSTIGNSILTWFGKIENDNPLLGTSNVSPFRFPTTVSENGVYYVAEQVSATCANYTGFTEVEIIAIEDLSTPIPSGVATHNLNNGGQIIVSSQGSHTFTFSASNLPTGVSFNTTTGEFTTSGSTLANVITPTTYPITIAILDKGINTGLTLIKNLIVNPVLQLADGTFPESKILNGTYSVNIASLISGGASGGNGSPITYSLSNPSLRSLSALPTGFTLSPTGTLSGTPTSENAGDYNFDIFATDGEQITSASFMLQINNAPLPVKLTKFKAKQVQQNAELYWETTEELNSARFEIEHSLDGKAWTMVSSISAGGNQTTISRYTETLNTPYNGQNYYRLKMIDLDGTYTYSRIEPLFITTRNIVYPNPVKSGENIHLDIPDFNTVAEVTINSAFGKTIFKSSKIPSEGIQSDILLPGLYIIQVLQKDGSMNSYKLIKQ